MAPSVTLVRVSDQCDNAPSAPPPRDPQDLSVHAVKTHSGPLWLPLLFRCPKIRQQQSITKAFPIDVRSSISAEIILSSAPDHRTFIIRQRRRLSFGSSNEGA
jgi:hypothetical protein